MSSPLTFKEDTKKEEKISQSFLERRFQSRIPYPFSFLRALRFLRVLRVLFNGQRFTRVCVSSTLMSARED